MILADTSIWIDHFRHVDAELRRIIEGDLLLCHPAVIGELALGSLRDRGSVIAFLAAQRAVVVAARRSYDNDQSPQSFQHRHWLHRCSFAGIRPT